MLCAQFPQFIHSVFICRHGGADRHRHSLLLHQLHGLRDREELAAEGGQGAGAGAVGGGRGLVGGDDHHRHGAGGKDQVSASGQAYKCHC